MTPNEPVSPPPPAEEPTATSASEADLAPALAAAYGPETEARATSREVEAGTLLAGRYRLIEAIGEGGMGSVWLAYQSEPVKRKVAIKLIKAGMDSRHVLMRFEAERQALAMMDHPNIAKVLDGGLHEGRPYFVMELVKGVPITEYCDARKLTPRQRLELFVPVCQAIQHAHQKGIIHRDIKPSNVLVALYDDRPVPKVIDFGVAKAMGSALTEGTLETGFGAVVGTPTYMSPEQATLNNLDIDTRSDVYSLGVLLYELLAGSPPFSKKELEKRGLLEMLRVVREEEPPRPSTKLSTAEALPSIAANRGVEPKNLTGLLRQELDWIVMKALEKDRSRRYETANGFAADVMRYLSGEPVQAHPPGRWYRVQKFILRHRGQVATAASVFLALVFGILGTTWGLYEARRQAELARQEAKEKEIAREEAIEQRRMAEANERRALEAVQAQGKATRRAESVTDFLVKKLLGQADPDQNPVGEKLTVRELLDRAAVEIEGETLAPEAEGAVRAILGKTYYGLSLDRQAEPHLRKALELLRRTEGPDGEATLEVTNDLALVLRALDRSGEAKKLIEGAIERLNQRYGPAHAKTRDALNTLAILYKDMGQMLEAERRFRQLLAASQKENGEDAEQSLTAVLNLVTVLRDSDIEKARQEAEAVLRRYLPAMQRRWGDNKPGIFVAYNELSLLLSERGAYSEAERYCQKILQHGPHVLGKDGDMVVNARNNLGLIRLEQGRNAEAEALFREVMAADAKVSSERARARTNFNLGMAIYRQNREDEGLKYFEVACEALVQLLGEGHPDTLHVSGQRTEVLIAIGDLEAAEKAARRCVELAASSREPSVAQMASVYRSELGYIQLLRGQGREAEATLREAVAELSRFGKNGPYHLDALSRLGEALLIQGKLEQAEPYLTTGYQGLLANRSQMPPRAYAYIVQALDRLILLSINQKKADLLRKYQAERMRLKRLRIEVPAYMLEYAGRGLMRASAFAEAEVLLREGWELRTKAQPTSWRTSLAQSLLGGALLGQKKYAEAEPLLLKGYEGMEAQIKSIPVAAKARIVEALDRLVELYTALKKPEEVKKYQQLRAEFAVPGPAEPKK